MAQALPYAEARVYEDRLNELCPGAWMVSFTPWGDTRLICELTIHELTRASTGEENDGFAPGTAAEQQAFKRACSKFGLGRFLYALPVRWVPYDVKGKRLLTTPTPTGPSSPPTSLPTTVNHELGRERAANMHKELALRGVPRSQHYSLASDALNYPVESFSSLTEADARKAWLVMTNRHNSTQQPIRG